MRDNFCSIPEEILEIIFGFCSYATLFKILITSKQFSRIVINFLKIYKRNFTVAAIGQYKERTEKLIFDFFPVFCWENEIPTICLHNINTKFLRDTGSSVSFSGCSYHFYNSPKIQISNSKSSNNQRNKNLILKNDLLIIFEHFGLKKDFILKFLNKIPSTTKVVKYKNGKTFQEKIEIFADSLDIQKNIKFLISADFKLYSIPVILSRPGKKIKLD